MGGCSCSCVVSWPAARPAPRARPDPARPACARRRGSEPAAVLAGAAGGPPLPVDLAGLLLEERAGRLATLAANAPETARIQLDQVRLAPPGPTPSKIIGIGLNYRDHAAETGPDMPTSTTGFAKIPN